MQHLKAHGTSALHAFAFKNRAKLSTLIDDVWSWETVDDTLRFLKMKRLDRLRQAATGVCICCGSWPAHAEQIIRNNDLDARAFFKDLLNALHKGRGPSVPVLVLAGREGGEGKSFFFAPISRLLFPRESSNLCRPIISKLFDVQLLPYTQGTATYYVMQLMHCPFGARNW